MEQIFNFLQVGGNSEIEKIKGWARLHSFLSCMHATGFLFFLITCFATLPPMIRLNHYAVLPIN